MTTPSFFWHDYETFGADPRRDWPCQFAGLRTDYEFNIVGEPLMVYCRPPDDYLPHPEACLITGITPQVARQRGVCEAEFAARIHAQLAQPGTCALGYNTLRFDDEVTRNLLYRNFYDPYAREWQNGNSRWDLIDIARAARALRPDGIQWPDNAEGVASFRLEELTRANGIGHADAHDALADVHATIAVAKLIKQHQPKLFNYLFEHRLKSQALGLLKLGSFTPLVHISARYPARNHCLAVVVALAQHPVNANEIIVYDLSADPGALLDLSAEQIRERLFVAKDDLPEGVTRIPLKTVHVNKAPVLAPLSVIRPADAERLQLDLGRCQIHLQQLQAAPPLVDKLGAVFRRDYADAPNDPDLMIYSGGFFSAGDKAAMNRIRQLSPDELADFDPGFDDARLPEMLFRYRARNYPETLTAEERGLWSAHCRRRLLEPAPDRPSTLESFKASIAALSPETDKQDPAILAQLLAYADELAAKLANPKK